MGPNVLVVNVNWAGDVLLSTAAIRALKKNVPGSRITCLLPRRCAAALQNNPSVDRILLCSDRDNLFSFFELLKVFFKLKRERFDTVFFFHRSRTKAFLAWAAGIPERIGYTRGSRDRFLSRCYAPPPRGTHRADIFLYLLECERIPLDGRTPDYFLPPGTGGRFHRVLETAGLRAGEYAVVHAGGNWALKRWPAAHWVRWIKLFLKEYPWKVVLCGTAGERELTDEIVSRAKDARVVSLCGKTDFEELGRLVQNGKLLVSNDSGPIHLGAGLRVPLVGLFGPTAISETGPLTEAAHALLAKDVGCEVPCYFRSCRSRVCMEWLTPEEVFEKTKEVLALSDKR